MTDNVPFVLVTSQPGAVGAPESNAYRVPSVEEGEILGHLFADGASPPMSFVVLPLQPEPDSA